MATKIEKGFWFLGGVNLGLPGEGMKKKKKEGRVLVAREEFSSGRGFGMEGWASKRAGGR